jgi:hypothetical protein
MTMIERVERALRNAESYDASLIEMARDAIAAMREPDEAMLDAGVNFRERNARTEQIWQAMIDAAIGEP